MSDDYRPDVYGQVEGSWRTAPPPQDVIDHAMGVTCPDCNVNVFIEESPEVDGEYNVKIAHDATCPWLREHEEADGR